MQRIPHINDAIGKKGINIFVKNKESMDKILSQVVGLFNNA